MTHRIVVVDGGAGRTVISNRLTEELGSETDDGDVGVTLASDDTKHVYKPVFLYVPFGVAEPDDGIRDPWDLVDERVDIVANCVHRVDADEKCLYCRDGNEELDYDTLILATGAKPDPDAVPGFREGTHHFYDAGGTERLRDALAEFEGGRLVSSVVGAPHMCPATPLKFTFIVDDRLRSRRLREDTDLVYTYPMKRSHEKPEVAEWVDPILAARDVRVGADFAVNTVDSDKRVALVKSGAEVDHDLLVGIPPHRGGELIIDSGLGDAGWVNMNQRTPHTTAAEDVYAIDGTVALPIPKVGSAAHFQAFVVAERIAVEVRGRTLTKHYDDETVCFVETGFDEASFVSFNYEMSATMRQPSKPVHWVEHAYNESYWPTARGML